MSSTTPDIGARQRIVAALATGSKTAEVAECLEISEEVVRAVADENAALITHMMVERTDRLAKQYDDELRRRRNLVLA